MQTELNQVRDFMTRHSIPTGARIEDGRMSQVPALVSAHMQVASHARILLDAWKVSGDVRVLRAHLILEEAAEVLDAMILRTETLLADGLADLTYVTLGTAVAFDIPLMQVFQEVHRSNMTKKVGSGQRVDDKGESYTPPNIEHAIKLGRAAS